ncbi:MAG: glycoside hydrolase family 2 TIM barrel-domain containing protein [Tannerellaceae bacterium]
MKFRCILSCVSLFLIALSLHAQSYIVPRLSPLPVNIKSEKVSLDGVWQFNPKPLANFWNTTAVSDWKTIEVPGEWVMQGYEVETGKPAGYFRTFRVPTQWNGQRVKLRCNGIYSDSHIYINGKLAGSHLGGFTAFELDVTDLVDVRKENRIAVSVVGESIADSTASGSKYAVHCLGGITRDLFLYAVPEINLSLFHASTSFDTTYTNAVLKTEIEIANESASSMNQLSLQFSLRDNSGKSIELSQSNVSLPQIAGKGILNKEISFSVMNPHKWNPEDPYLYTLTCALKDGSKTVYEASRRIGFRQIDVRGNQLFVNNSPVKLRGVCRHEVMPLRGRSVTGDIWKQDVELFRQGNVNYIRTSHYPPDEALLDACDELGMFVEVEAPFCWAHNTKVPDSLHNQVLVNQHVEMVNLNRSHPSVIMWSLGNESNLFEEYFSKAGEVIKQIDPTRPRIFSQWGPDADNGKLEITNHHYPGPTGPNTYRNSKRPVVFDEFCHLNAYNRLELAADPGLRDMWGELLDKMWTDMYNSQGVLGGALWAGIDDTFFLPGDRAVGYGTWGPIDGWRREKPEYWSMKKAFSPVKIRLTGNVDQQGYIVLDIENRHDFTNLSACKIEWSVGKENGVINPDIAPHSKGQAKIKVSEKELNQGNLIVKVTGARGFVIDEYDLQVFPDQRADAKAKSLQPVVFKDLKNELVMQHQNQVYSVNKHNGLLNVTLAGSDVLLESPQLMVLPLNGEGEGIQMVGKDQKFTPYNPVCKHWIAESIEHLSDKHSHSIKVKGQYEEAEGAFIYTVHDNGEVEVAYDFELKKDVSPRQLGIVFTLPSNFDQLNWKRKGYWSVYPKDHIAAISGHAEAFKKEMPISGLAGPSAQPTQAWSYDQTAAGSNLFRSTKERITEASLDNGRDRIMVTSDGNQHARAWIEDGVIKFLIADYINAGSENFLVPHAEKAYRPLRKGDKITGKVRLHIEKK